MSDDKVGYKKPPKGTRFKKGKSGNPKGRPKKQPSDDFGEALLKALEYPATIYVADQKMRVTAREAIVHKFSHEASKGELNAIDDILLLKNIPGDYRADVYVFAGHCGVPPPPKEGKVDEEKGI